MLKIMPFTLLCIIYLLCSTDAAGQEEDTVKLLELHEPMAVSVSNEDLKEVSSSVLMAESWVKTRVLAHFPATKIAIIVVGSSVPCDRDHEEKWGLVIPSAKNIYYSLVRWGLEREIKVTTGFSSDCLDFFSSLSDEKTMNLVSVHSQAMKKLGFFNLNEINPINPSSKQKKPINRKLSVIDPFPARPTPLPELPPSPIHSSIGFSSVPAHASKFKNPLPPLTGIAPQPSISFPFTPENSPVVVPTNPPEEPPTLPPCNAVDMGAPTPETGEERGLWCVAKPSVPTEKLQEALNYACGEGGADCQEISPHGSCYYPDSVAAHASYAFNSFWQKNKRKGGTCSFGGTAMIINADPSYLHCRFLLS